MSTINLLPEDFVKRRAQRRANVLCLFLFIAVMGGVLGAAYVSDRSRKETQEVCDRVNTSYTKAAELIGQMQQLELRKSQMLRKAEMAASLVERLPRSTILAMISQALPEDAALLEINLTTTMLALADEGGGDSGRPKSRLTNAPRAEIARSASLVVEMVIKGLASPDVDIGDFIRGLKRSPLVDSVEVAYIKEEMVTPTARKGQAAEKIKAREFEVSVNLKPNADAMDILGGRESDVVQTGEGGGRLSGAIQ